MLLDEISLRASAASLSSGPENQTNSIAHAQAIQYARDLITAMRQKREQQHRLELTSQQLIRAEKLATVGHVAATVAHELGNIFTPLLMYAKLIYKETAGDEQSEVAEYLARRLPEEGLNSHAAGPASSGGASLSWNSPRIIDRNSESAAVRSAPRFSRSPPMRKMVSVP